MFRQALSPAKPSQPSAEQIRMSRLASVEVGNLGEILDSATGDLDLESYYVDIVPNNEPDG